MNDMSHLDKKYFIDDKVYNCPFCNRNNVGYSIENYFSFHWTNIKTCIVYFVRCSSCNKESMHLSYKVLLQKRPGVHGSSSVGYYQSFNNQLNIDDEIFYSVPTSFFTIDSRIPEIVRECVSEAEGCLKMNYLTGASACMRKAIYELCVIEEAEGSCYEDKIKSLKNKNPQSDPELFEILSHIQNMTSDKVHEQSWDKWDSTYLKLIIETLKTVLYEIYVLPKERKERSSIIKNLRESVTINKSGES